MPRPSDGSQRSVTENRRMSRSPNQNTGIAWRARAIHMTTERSRALLDSRIASPIAKASTSPRMNAVSASSSVAGRRSSTSPSADVR